VPCLHSEYSGYNKAKFHNFIQVNAGRHLKPNQVSDIRIQIYKYITVNAIKNPTNPLVIESFMYNTVNMNQQHDQLTDTRIEVWSNIDTPNPNKPLAVEPKRTMPLMLLIPINQPAL